MNISLPDNVINNPAEANKVINIPAEAENVLTNSFELPSIITSHLYSDDPFVDLVQHSTRKSLMIYVHREENERVLSAIKQILDTMCSGTNVPEYAATAGFNSSELNLVVNKTDCILNEMPFVKLIKKQVAEVGFGASGIMTCKTYDVIEQNAPDMIFMHYKRANQLQMLLAKQHCPELMSTPMVTNVGQRMIQVYLRLHKGGDIVHIKAWLEQKAPFLEYSLKLRNHATCQGKTRHMEDDLFACPDQTIIVSDIRHW